MLKRIVFTLVFFVSACVTVNIYFPAAAVERADVNQLIEAENKDREALYAEIAKANSISSDNIPRIKSIFAKSWIEQARPGWWIQSGGNWQKK